MLDAAALDMLADLLATDGVVVALTRGEQQGSFMALRGRTAKEEVGRDGLVTSHEYRDWLCLAADYRLAGVAVEPAAGDQLAITEGGRTYTYRVTSPGEEAPWRWWDRNHTYYRIHTIEAGAADA